MVLGRLRSAITNKLILVSVLGCHGYMRRQTKRNRSDIYIPSDIIELCNLWYHGSLRPNQMMLEDIPEDVTNEEAKDALDGLRQGLSNENVELS